MLYSGLFRVEWSAEICLRYLTYDTVAGVTMDSNIGPSALIGRHVQRREEPRTGRRRTDTCARTQPLIFMREKRIR